MKKLAKFLMLPIALLAALGFAACQPSKPTSSSSSEVTENSSSNVENSSEVEDSSSSVEEVYVAPTTVADAVSVALKNANKVVTGTAAEMATTVSEGESYTTVSQLTYGMIYGQYFEMTMVTNPDTDPYTESNRYVLMENESVYGVAYDAGFDQWNVAYEPTMDNLAGYYFHLGDMLWANGTENWLNTLYSFAAELPAENKTNVPLMESVEDGIYSFAFDYATALYYKVVVSFTLDENGMCDSLNWVVNSWWNGQTQDDEGNWLTMDSEDADGNPITVPAGEDWSGMYPADFAWDVENECWYLIAEEDSWNDSQAWSLTQSAEGEVEEKASQFYITSMSIKDMDGNAVPEELTMVPGGDSLFLVMTDVVPGTASLSANNIEVVIDSESYSLSASVGYFDWETFEEYNDIIEFTAYGAGEFPVAITVNGTVVAEFTITAEAPLPESMEVGYVVDGSVETVYEEYSMFVGTEVTFIGKADNNYADASAEFTVTDESGAEVDCYTLTTVETVAGEIDAIVFAPTATGTYIVSLVSTVVDGLTASITVVVEEALDLNTILTGTYYIDFYGEICGTISFDNGVATIEYTGGEAPVEAVLSYEVVEEDGVQTLETTLTSGSGALDFTIDNDFALIVLFDYNYGTEYEGFMIGEFSTSVYESVSYADILTGAYSFSNYWDTEGTITFEDGVATIVAVVEVWGDGDEPTYETLTAKYNYTITTVDGEEVLNTTFVEGAEEFGFVVNYGTLYVTQTAMWGGANNYPVTPVFAE